MKRQDSFELLVRGLYDLPTQPAIINLQWVPTECQAIVLFPGLHVRVLALSFPNLMVGHDMHAGLAEYYDIPSISLRNMWLHQVLRNYTFMQDIFCPSPYVEDTRNVRDGYDQRHINPYAHGVMANLVTTYIETQLCEMDRIEAAAAAAGRSTDIDALYPLQPIPRMRAVDKFLPDVTVPPVRPNCFSTNGLKHKLVAHENKGWREWNWEEKVGLEK